MSQMGVYGVGARRAARSKSASEAGTPASLADIEGRPGYAGASPNDRGYAGPFEASSVRHNRHACSVRRHDQPTRLEQARLYEIRRRPLHSIGEDRLLATRK